MKVIETRSAVIHVDEMGIHRATCKAVAQDVNDAKENVAVSKKLSGGKKVLLYIDIRKLKSQTRECQVYYSGPAGCEVYSAVAILIQSVLSKVIANFFMGLRRPPIPIRLFTDEAEAFAWLKTEGEKKPEAA